ncbi:MAG: SIS domain-containing protein [Candidatus Heimdallarchaeota archaeon]|nr:SIS domain-containing protein [Candidatus Heimdallarchaeota archaeon]MCK5049495.1 SIS domain-containing protein [Candidatus Heimdallarchaeota archaeon]
MNDEIVEPHYMFDEILEQPTVLQRILDNWISIKENWSQPLHEKQWEKILITGSGDSFCASEVGSYAISELSGISCYALKPLELARYRQDLFGPSTLVIVISVSGKTPRILEVVRQAMRYNCPILAITDNLESPIANECSDVFYLQTAPQNSLSSSSFTGEASAYDGYQHSVAQTKTYTANIMALFLFACELGLYKNHPKAVIAKKQLASLPSLIEALLSKEQLVKYKEISQELPVKPLIFAGSGPNYGTALFASFKAYEFAFQASFHEIEEYCHTSYFITSPETPVIFFASSGASLERTKEIYPVLSDHIGAYPLVITDANIEEFEKGKNLILETNNLLEIFTPIALIIPWQIIIYNLAKQRGLDVNMFRGGILTDHYVVGSLKTIRGSKIWTEK